MRWHRVVMKQGKVYPPTRPTVMTTNTAQNNIRKTVKTKPLCVDWGVEVHFIQTPVTCLQSPEESEGKSQSPGVGG